MSLDIVRSWIRCQGKLVVTKRKRSLKTSDRVTALFSQLHWQNSAMQSRYTNEEPFLTRPDQ